MNNDTSKLHLHGPISVARSETACWKCKKTTPVHALFARDLEDHEPGEEPWRVEAESFVFDLPSTSLPAHVVAALARVAPNFKPIYSRTQGSSSWANICVHCGLLQGSFFLHQEPEGPFFGSVDGFDGATTRVSEVGFDVASGSFTM